MYRSLLRRFMSSSWPRHPRRGVYLDMASTTPLDPRVLDAMLPFLTERFGNPHSRTHEYGWDAEAAVEKARAQVASLLSVEPADIVFTSGATESNNIAIKGVARFHNTGRTPKNHIVTLQTEHKCVLDSCRSLEMEGFDVSYLPVQPNGIVNLKVLENALKSTTSLVSCMFVNNEVGVIQPIENIAAICNAQRILFHTDAAQAVGKMLVDATKVDLMSISGHKIYGPKGIGALYVRRRRPRVRLRSPISGGGQERGIRSGTLPTALCVGLGEACAIAQREHQRDAIRITALRQRLCEKLNASLSHLVFNGDPVHSLPGLINISFECVEGESLLMGIRTASLSSGSACTSASLEPSYVLRAMSVDAVNAHTSLRFGIGRFTTKEEIDFVAERCISEVQRLRAMSPLWDLKMEEEASKKESPNN